MGKKIKWERNEEMKGAEVKWTDYVGTWKLLQMETSKFSSHCRGEYFWKIYIAAKL